MQFSAIYTGLALASLANGAAVQHAAHRNHKRALEIVTVTDVVWDVVTVTEYDDVEAATTIAPAAVVTSTPAVAAVQPASTTSSIPVVTSTPVAVVQQSATPVEQVHTTTTTSSSSSSSSSSISSSTTPAVPSSTTTAVVAGNVAVASSTTSAAVAVATTSNTGTYSGQGTYYELGLTACGQTYTDSDYVAAISYLLFDQDGTANPNNNPHCGKKIRVYRGEASVDVTIVDRCAGCEGTYNVDLSPVAFQTIATEAEGRVDITWSYL